jgi:hypothetical protein
MNRYLLPWLISTQHSAVCPSGNGEDPTDLSLLKRFTGGRDRPEAGAVVRVADEQRIGSAISCGLHVLTMCDT